MTGKEFLNSKWMAAARRPGAARDLTSRLARWTSRVRNLKLLSRARELYAYFQSGRVTRMEKALVLAALLYLISPVDVVPDWIPVAGLVDDLGVATFVLRYILKKVDASQAIEGT